MADDTKILGAGEITLITNTVYGAGKGYEVNITHALENSPLGELFLYGITSDLSATAITSQVEIVFTDENNSVLCSYELNLTWKGYEYDEEIEDRVEVVTDIELNCYAKYGTVSSLDDFYIDEWQVTNGLLNYYDTTTTPPTLETTYLNANNPDYEDELDSDQKREYITNWNNILIPAETCKMKIYTCEENPRSIYFSLKWINNTNANSSTAAKIITTDNEQKVNGYLLDRAIDINREEGKIQVGVDTREHLVIKNDGVTISQGETMESQFTGKYVQLGLYRLYANYGGIAFILTPPEEK